MAVFSAIAAGTWFAGLSGIAAKVAAVAIGIGQAVSWSIASAVLMRPKVDRQTVQATIMQPDQPRVRGWGRNLFGGVKVFFDARNDVLRQIVVAHHGPVDGLIQFWMDGQPIKVDPNGHNQRYRYLFFRDGHGAGGGGDYAGVRNAFPEFWTPEHRLEGQATFCMEWGDPSDGDFPKVFPKGAQTVVQVELRASRVANLDGDLIYSENAALCLRDFITHADGWNIDPAHLDPESWINFTILCAEAVALAGGGFEPRYRLCGYYTLEDALKDVTARMLATCDGQIYETADGKIGILGGAWSEPDVTIHGDDILSIKMSDGYNPLSTYNVLQGAFVSPAHAYQTVDVAELVDEVALETEERRVDRLEAEMCPSGSQLQRLMKIKMAKDRREITGTIRTNLVGLKARFPKGDGIHTIRIVAEEFGLDGIFEVTSHTFSIEGGWCEIGIASISAEAYEWDAASEEKPLPPTYASIGTPSNVQPPPQNAVISQVPVTINQTVQAVKLVITVDDPGRDGLELQAQIASGSQTDPNADVSWTEMPASQLRAESGVLDDGETYTVRIKWKNRTDFVIAGSVTVVANPDQPNAPTSFSALAVGDAVALDWINASDDFNRTQLRRGQSDVFVASTFLRNVSGAPGAVTDYTDQPPAAGTWYYWALTINPSGIQSDPAGPAVVTILPPEPPPEAG